MLNSIDLDPFRADRFVLDKDARAAKDSGNQ